MKYAENCVYAVEVPNGFKVGYTSRLGDRLSSFQKRNGCACYPYALVTGLSRNDAQDLEAEIHGKLAQFHVGQETFDCTERDLRDAFANRGRVLS